MHRPPSEFGQQADLAEELLAALGTDGDDGSHDQSHVLRVWRNATVIADQEPDCDMAVLTAAVILHDCVAMENASFARTLASHLSAVRARAILTGLGWDASLIERVAHAIEAHSFSAAITPETMEARVVRDADRLDAIGAIGIARFVGVGGSMGVGLGETSYAGPTNTTLFGKSDSDSSNTSTAPSRPSSLGEMTQKLSVTWSQ